MHNMLKQVKNLIVISLLSMLFPTYALAQKSSMEETMYAHGKINVTYAVVLVMLLIMLGYLVILDRRLRKLENEENLDK